MSCLVKNKASSEVASLGSTSSAWIADAFDCYEIPPEIGQNVVDPLDEHTHYKCQVRHLGPAYLKSGCFSAIQANFYEVTRSEISELKKVKRHSHSSSFGAVGADTHLDTHDTDCGGVAPFKDVDALLYLSETAHTPLPGSNPSTTAGASAVSCLALPPKKRKKRTVIQHCVVFSLTKDQQAHQDLSSLSPVCTYYLFPRNSLIDVVNDMAPYQIFCTFHLSKPSSVLQNSWTYYNIGSPLSPSSRNKYRTKLEEFAAVCDSSDRLLSIGPHDQIQSQLLNSHSFASENQSINVEISGASGDVHCSLKQSVSGYQASCQKMADLLYLHNQWATSYKTEFSLYPDHFLPYKQQSTLSKTHDQILKCHHENAKVKSASISSSSSSITSSSGTTSSSASTSSSSHNQRHGYINQRQNSFTGGVEGACGNSIKTKKWANSKKKHSTGGSDSKLEGFDKDNVPPPSKNKKTKRNSSSRGKESATCTRKCIYCNATSTPMWRRGPEGAGTLCNACGVKWKHGKILSGYETSPQINGSSNTDLEEFDNSCNKRKKPTTGTKKEKKIRTTTTTTKPKRMTNDTITTVKGDLTVEDDVDASVDLRLHEDSHGHCGSATTTNDNSYHHRSFRSTNYDNNDMMNYSSSTTTTTSSSQSLTAMTMTKGGSHLHSSTASTLLSQQSIMLSSESIYNSSLTSLTSTPNSSPPMSMDSQQHRGLLPLSFPEKFGLDDGDHTLPLSAGADDVEAAAVLTLLRRS